MTVKRKGEVGAGKSRQAKRKKGRRKIVKLESLKPLNLTAAGLDIGAVEI